MSDLKHLTHDEGHALAAFRAGLNCDEEVEQVFKALAELRAALDGQKELVEIPTGAIENGREHMRRLEEHYQFECEGGPLRDCTDWVQLKMCFEWLVDALAKHKEEA